MRTPLNTLFEEKEKVHVIDSVVAKCYKDGLDKIIEVLRKEPDIEDVFVILHFDGPPEHFACLHVKKSSVVYYDSLRNNNDRPFNEYPQLKELKDIEFHVPAKDEWQVDKECGCMVVLRYWQLFHNAKHHKLRGKEARDQVLKYYKQRQQQTS